MERGGIYILHGESWTLQIQNTLFYLFIYLNFTKTNSLINCANVGHLLSFLRSSSLYSLAPFKSFELIMKKVGKKYLFSLIS